MRRLAVAAGLLLLPAVGAGADSAPNRALIDRSLAALLAAPDDQAAAAIEQRLHELWQQGSTPAPLMLLRRSVQELNANAPDDAVADLDAALTLDPDYVEAYNDRAAARLMAGDALGAARDAGEALKREPRHFAALQTLSRAAEARGDWKTALDAWQRALALDPQTHDGHARLNLLRQHAEGEAT